MSLTKNRTLEIPLKPESYETADQFIKQWLIQKRISDESSFETMLLFEALFHDMIEQGCGQDTMLTIRTQKTFGEYNITLGFEGESYIPSMKKDRKSISPELQIVQAYSDKVGYRYRLGYNRVSIVVKRNNNSSLLYCLIAILLAVPVSIALIAFVSADNLISLDNKVIQPVIKQFANAMLMIGAPVTFFSLVKNLTDIYIVSEKLIRQKTADKNYSHFLYCGSTCAGNGTSNCGCFIHA